MLARVGLACGRQYLEIAGIVVAMEGDKCRHDLPDEIAEPIPISILERSVIGGKSCIELPLSLVRSIRGENWRPESLEWAAEKINKEFNSAHFARYTGDDV